ncbi:cation diffusion facilitator family transporter [Desulfovibrio sp. X2]|uniref:cation diffusion facilitator family transporter n=1 Tax=Desulfovibrio sp. X2 TaxID=941449 RepID=UPI000358B6A3|nr:cation diffusion facilitator family transporter [Desulfovibrio sp. X2]EPR41744.1 cation diffusion facilitator family transporter [Desulfovibrio sp. X2]
MQVTSVRRYAMLSVAASIIGLILKFGAWYMTSSVGLLSDAMESLVNLSAGIIAVIALTVAHAPPDKRHAYGHGKAEYFSSGMEGLLVLCAAVGIAGAAVDRFLHPATLAHLGPGLLAAVAAAAVNWGVARVMLRAAREYDSIVLEADARHLMTDVWTSAGLVAALTILLFAPTLGFLDPLLAAIMAVNIAHTGWELLRRSVGGLMDHSLPEEEEEAIVEAVRRIGPERSEIHALRTRKSGRQRFVEFHFLLPGETTVKRAHDVCCDVENELKRILPAMNVSIHVEPLEEQAAEEGGAMPERHCPEDGPPDY